MSATENPKGITRRTFLKYLGIITGGIVGACAASSVPEPLHAYEDPFTVENILKLAEKDPGQLLNHMLDIQIKSPEPVWDNVGRILDSEDRKHAHEPRYFRLKSAILQIALADIYNGVTDYRRKREMEIIMNDLGRPDTYYDHTFVSLFGKNIQSYDPVATRELTQISGPEKISQAMVQMTTSDELKAEDAKHDKEKEYVPVHTAVAQALWKHIDQPDYTNKSWLDQVLSIRGNNAEERQKTTLHLSYAKYIKKMVAFADQRVKDIQREPAIRNKYANDIVTANKDVGEIWCDMYDSPTHRSTALIMALTSLTNTEACVLLDQYAIENPHDPPQNLLSQLLVTSLVLGGAAGGVKQELLAPLFKSVGLESAGLLVGRLFPENKDVDLTRSLHQVVGINGKAPIDLLHDLLIQSVDNKTTLRLGGFDTDPQITVSGFKTASVPLGELLDDPNMCRNFDFEALSYDAEKSMAKGILRFNGIIPTKKSLGQLGKHDEHPRVYDAGQLNQYIDAINNGGVMVDMKINHSKFMQFCGTSTPAVEINDQGGLVFPRLNMQAHMATMLALGIPNIDTLLNDGTDIKFNIPLNAVDSKGNPIVLNPKSQFIWITAVDYEKGLAIVTVPNLDKNVGPSEWAKQTISYEKYQVRFSELLSRVDYKVGPPLGIFAAIVLLEVASSSGALKWMAEKAPKIIEALEPLLEAGARTIGGAAIKSLSTLAELIGAIGIRTLEGGAAALEFGWKNLGTPLATETVKLYVELLKLALRGIALAIPKTRTQAGLEYIFADFMLGGRMTETVFGVVGEAIQNMHGQFQQIWQSLWEKEGSPIDFLGQGSKTTPVAWIKAKQIAQARDHDDLSQLHAYLDSKQTQPPIPLLVQNHKLFDYNAQKMMEISSQNAHNMNKVSDLPYAV